MRKIVFESSAFDEFHAWASIDKQVFKKLGSIIRDIQRDPYTGIGKPEPLRHSKSGYWSRRITGKHRIVFKIAEESIFIANVRDHYSDS